MRIGQLLQSAGSLNLDSLQISNNVLGIKCNDMKQFMNLSAEGRTLYSHRRTPLFSHMPNRFTVFLGLFTHVAPIGDSISYGALSAGAFIFKVVMGKFHMMLEQIYNTMQTNFLIEFSRGGKRGNKEQEQHFLTIYKQNG